MSDLAPIRDEAGYGAALAEVRRLWGAEAGTPAGDRLEVLTILIDAYENEHHRIDPPDPIEAIRIRMEELGLDRADLGRMLGTTPSGVGDLLNRRRRLSPPLIRALSAGLKLSEACLLQPYDLAVRSRPAAE